MIEIHEVLAMRSLVSDDGKLTVSLERTEIGIPASGELIVEMSTAPVNPSDLGTMLGLVDVATLRNEGNGDMVRLIGDIPASALVGIRGRVGQAMPVGLEGAGTVVAAGVGDETLIGRKVAIFSTGTYAQYCRVKRSDCLVLPDGVTTRQAASCFVNPLTALSMIEVMRLNGHRALVHTAAASNLGQMLNRLCLADGIGLVNVVRTPGQALLLREAGAAHVCDLSEDDFDARLLDALAVTGATLAFDAIGGGTIGGRILHAMEQAIARHGGGFSRYGSTTTKQLYIYGGLDRSPTVIARSFGMAWSAAGWLMPPFIASLDPARTEELRARVVAYLDTLFASQYDRELSLVDALDADHARAMMKRSTGKKTLILPGAGRW